MNMDDHNQLDHIESKLDNQHNHSSEWLYFDPGRWWDEDQHYYLYQQQQQQQDNYTFYSTTSFDHQHHYHLPSHFHFDPFTDFQWYFLDNNNNNNIVEDDTKGELVGATTRMMMIMNDIGGDNIIDQLSRSGRSPPSSSLSSKSAGGIGLEEIQKHFDVPIMKAAKELKISLTLLKKRCRELNITRWPHRKIKSLNSLIHNFKELGKSRKDIEMLEDHKRMLEKEPDLDLTDTTKRLRQACFKLNYKKKRSRTSLPYV